MDVLPLNFSGAAKADLITSINSGTNFQIIIGATVDTNDITYSGVANTFDPGPPNLTITVPEPSTVILLLAGLVGLIRRR